MPAREPLSADQVDAALARLRGWTRDGDRIVREVQFDDFRAAFAFLVRVAFEAEAMDHHPEIFNVYNTVRLTLSTHDAGNQVTETDLTLAERIDRLAGDAAPR